MRRSLAALASAAALLVALTACSSDELAEQYRSGDGKGYISGSGVVEVSEAQRGDPIDFSGPTTEGTTIDSTDYRGEVLVVNFWYAQCPPCRSEASDLQKLAEKYGDENVQFVGINTRDQQASADAFDQEFGVTYPSILDADDGQAQLAFSDTYRPNATPTTFVLDAEGRVAARIEGPINLQPSTLDTLISDTAAEESSNAS